MKIGIFTDSYLPYTSGVVKSIEVFKEEYIKNGHEVYIFAPKYSKCSKEGRVFRFTSVPSLVHPGYNLAIPVSIKVSPLVKSLDLDIIHVHSPFLLGRVGAKYAKKLNIPLVVTFHTLYDQYVHYIPFAQKTTKEITRKICRNFCNGCDLVITPTKVVASYVAGLGVKTPIRAIPTGIEVDKFLNGNKKWLRQTYNIPLNQRILLFVGRLGQEKNIFFLLEAFEKIHQEFSEVCLVLVGEGPEEEHLKAKVHKLGLEDKVIFTGKLPWDNVVDCYHGMDIFAFPSVTETQGLVIGEAKAAGKPVVAIKAFGSREMVEDGVDGFLTELDQDAFCQKLLALVKDEELCQKMGQKAKEDVIKISSKECAKKMLCIYQELIKNKKDKD